MEQDIDKYRININLFNDTSILEVLDFEELPILYVETDTIGTLYLSYLDKFINEDIEQRLVIKISREQLKKLKKGFVSVKSVFQSPETNFIFLNHLNQLNGQFEAIYLLPNDIFQQFNRIDENYYIEQYEEPIDIEEQFVAINKKDRFPIARYDESILKICHEILTPNQNEMGITGKYYENIEKMPYKSSKFPFFLWT